jgi:hypothetical protein
MSSIVLLFAFLPALIDLRVCWRPASSGDLQTLFDSLKATSILRSCAEQRPKTAPALCIWRRKSSLMIPGLTCVCSSYVGAPPLHDCSPCSWLDGVTPQP